MNSAPIPTRPDDIYYEESPSEKLVRKAKASPLMVGGVAGCVGVLLYAAYNFKNKGNMKTSVYLINTRVAAQGLVVGSLTVGMVYSMFSEYALPKIKEIFNDAESK